jgi:hypothetical protein
MITFLPILTSLPMIAFEPVITSLPVISREKEKMLGYFNGEKLRKALRGVLLIMNGAKNRVLSIFSL